MIFLNLKKIKKILNFIFCKQFGKQIKKMNFYFKNYI